MNVMPELSAQDNAVRNAAINELFRRKMTRNTENIRKIAECLPFLWGEEAESCLEAMRRAASGEGFIPAEPGHCADGADDGTTVFTLRENTESLSSGNLPAGRAGRKRKNICGGQFLSIKTGCALRADE